MKNCIESQSSLDYLLKDNPPIKTTLSIVILAIIISVSVFVAKWGIGFFDEMENWGQIGDFFGGILNPIIGFAGIILIAYTLKQNQKALALTAQELRCSNEQLSLSASSLKCQENLMRQEAKTNALTNLLSIFKDEIARERANKSSIYGSAVKIRQKLNKSEFCEIPNLLRAFNYSGHSNIRFFSTIAFLVDSSEDGEFKTHLHHLVICYLSYEVIAAMCITSHYTSSISPVSKRINNLCRASLLDYELDPLVKLIDEYLTIYPN